MVNFPAGTTRIGLHDIPISQSAIDKGALYPAPPVPNTGGRGQHTPGEMNATEMAYSEHLTRLQLIKEVLWWKHEPAAFKLAHRCTYTPDFMVMMADCAIEMHEVKGHMEDDAAAKVRIFSEQFPFPVFVVKRDGGNWTKVRW